MRPVRIAWLVAVLVTGTATASTAATDSPGGATPERRIERASRVMERAASMRFAGHMKIMTDAAVASPKGWGWVEGVMHLRRERASFSIESEGEPPFRVLVIDGRTYLPIDFALPEVQAQLPGKRWLRSRRHRFPMHDMFNPMGWLIGMGSVKEASHVTGDRVRSRRTERFHYERAEAWDISKIPPPARGYLLAGSSGTQSRIERWVDVWLDNRSRVRRIDAEILLVNAQRHTGYRLRLEFWDFGTDEKVRAPKPEEVGDIEDVKLERPPAELVT